MSENFPRWDILYAMWNVALNPAISVKTGEMSLLKKQQNKKKGDKNVNTKPAFYVSSQETDWENPPTSYISNMLSVRCRCHANCVTMVMEREL